MTVLISGRVSYEVGDRPVLTEVEIEIRRAESVAIVGVNGVGKTTLLRLMANVLEPTGGGLCLDKFKRGTPLNASFVNNDLK